MGEDHAQEDSGATTPLSQSAPAATRAAAAAAVMAVGDVERGQRLELVT